MKEDLAINRSGRRRSPDPKKSKKLNKLVDSSHKDLGSKSLSVAIERYDLGKNRSPDKSSKIPTRKDDEEDSESEPLSQVASRRPKQYPEPKNVISSKQTVEGDASKVSKDETKDLKCAKMPNKIEDKKMEIVKKDDKNPKVNKKEDKVVAKSDETVKKSVDVNLKSGKVKSKKATENSTEVDLKVLDAEKKSKSPQRVSNAPLQSKQGIKKLLESTIRNRMKKRTSDESEQNPPEIKKRKVGRPPKNKDNEKESSAKNPSSILEETKLDDATEKQIKTEIKKKVGRKKKILDNKRHEEKESEPEEKEYQNVSGKTNKKVKFSKDETNSGDETEKDRKVSDESEAEKNIKKNAHKEDSDTENEKGKKVVKKRQGKKWSITKNESTGKPRKFVRKKKQNGVQSLRDCPSSDTDCEKSLKKQMKKKSNKTNKHESCESESDEKSKNSKLTNKKKSESENSDSSQKPKKSVKVGKKVLKLRSRFRRKRVASLNARAKVTCMVDEDSDPIDFNHYITMFPVVVGDDVILRKKKKKGVFMMRRRKLRQPEAPQLEMKDFIVPKRMASLNATAMMAASTDLDRRKRDDDPLKSPSRKDEEVEEKKEEQNDSKKIFKKMEDATKKSLKKIEESKPDIDVYEFHCDDKPLKITKKKIDQEKKNIPLKKRKRVEMRESPATSPAHSTEMKIQKASPEQPKEANLEDTVQSDPEKQTQGVLDLRSPQSLAIPPAVDAIFKTSDAVTISGVYIDARCSSQSSSHSYVISGSMQAYNYSVATRTEERRTVTPPPSQPTVAKVRPYNPLGALCGMRIPDQPQSQGHPPNDPNWRPAESKNQSLQESGHTSAFQTPPGQCQQGPNVGWYQPAGPLIHTPYKPPSERQSPEPSTSRPKTPPLEKREEPIAPSPDKIQSPVPEWHNAPPDRGFHHYYPYPPAPYPFYHYPPLPPSSSAQTRDGYSGYPGPPLPHPHPVYPYQGASYYPPPPPSHQGYPPYDPYGPYRQSANTLVPPPAGSPGSTYPVRPHLVRPTVLPAPTPYYPPYYGCHQQSAPIQPPHYDPRHMRCSCPVRSPTCPKNVQPGPLTGEGVGPGYHVENPHAPVAPGPRTLASPASGSVPRNMESQIPGSGAKVVESEVLPSIEKKYLSAKEMKKLLKSIDLETCRTVWKQKKAERKRQKLEKQRTFNGCVTEYSSGTDDIQDNIPLKYLAKEIKLEKVDDFESDLTNSSSSESNPISVKTECIKVEDEPVMSPVIPAPIADIRVSEAPELDGNNEHGVNVQNEESDPSKKLQKKRSVQQKNELETNAVKKRGRKRTVTTLPAIASPVRRAGSVNSRNSARASSRSSSATLLETQDSRQEILEGDDRKSRQGPSVSCGWSWYGEPYEAKVFLSNDDPPVLRRCYPSMRHEEGEIIRVRDSVILRSGTRPSDLPYVAKVSAMWDNPDDGEMMISILWFYRPEHTDRGRKPGDKNDEVFASRHRDTTYVACIEDKCHVLTYNEYCRYRSMITRIDEGNWPPSSAPIVPALAKESGDSDSFRLDRFPATKMGADRVFLCRKVYDCRQKRILKNPA